MRKLTYGYAKTKAQISFAVTAKLISAFVFAPYDPVSSFIQNFKIIAYFCDSTGLVGNPNCWFSRAKARLEAVMAPRMIGT